MATDEAPSFLTALFHHLNDPLVLSQLPALPRGLLEPARIIVAIAQ